LTVL